MWAWAISGSWAEGMSGLEPACSPAGPRMSSGRAGLSGLWAVEAALSFLRDS